MSKLLQSKPLGLTAIVAVLVCLGPTAGCRDSKDLPGGDVGSSSRGTGPGGSAAGLPNIVFAVYDNTRLDRYSLGGNTRNTSPFLAELAAEGIYLANAIAPATWTFPSHASMFTGYRNHQLRVDMENENNLVIAPGAPTIAELLAGRGYLTVTYPDHPYFGPVNASLSRGFRYFDMMFNPLETPSLSFTNVPDGLLNDRRITIPKPPLEEDLRLKAEFRDRLGGGDGPYTKPPSEGEKFPSVTPYVSKYVPQRYAGLMEVLTTRGDRPFFLFLNLHNGPKHLTTYNDNVRWLMEYLEENGLGPVDWDKFNDLDDGFLKSDYIIAFCDATLRALYEMFSSTPGMENTVYVVASDHGQAHGEHGERTYYKHAYSLPWEYMVRAPAVIWFPESLRAEYPTGRVEERVSLTDLFFTLAEIGGCGELPQVREVAKLNGESILQRMRDRHFEEYVVTESFMVIAYEEIKAMMPELAVAVGLRDDEILTGNVYAVYKGPFKLVYAPQCYIQGRPRTRFVEVKLLLDVQADPQEMRNVAAEHPEVLQDLMEAYRRHKDIEKKVSFQASRKLSYDDRTKQQLQELGYLPSEESPE
ncbi:MAG: sulfatase-like hydrolase/transferase [Phycisphaerales bacterium]|nr:MAG: sulfatase-like hydrolase/transferase [Phycisphaerales bacterium]